MGVLIVNSESEIFAIFLLYVFYDTKPAAFNVHSLINVSLINAVRFFLYSNHVSNFK